MKDLISIIIPVYNHQKELQKALDSIYAQTYKNIEVIVVDDGSEDQIANNKYPIVLIRQKNKGAPNARNRGLMEAKGDYVIFWDADVMGEPEMLQTMINVLQENSTASFTYSNHYFGKKKFGLKPFNLSTLKQNNYIHSTSLIKKEDAIQWDESLKRFQDWDYWLTFAEQGKKGIWIDEYLFKVIPGGTMSKWLPKFVYKKPWKFLPWISGSVRKYEDARAVILLKHSLSNTD